MPEEPLMNFIWKPHHKILLFDFRNEVKKRASERESENGKGKAKK
jgi:hypothetical protein